MTKRILVLSLLCAGVACTTPGKRYEDASEDEAEGRWASACEKYLDVLRRDPEYPGAREKARETGGKAIAGWLRVANGLDQAGRFDRALDEYARVDALLDRAAGVGVVLETPEDYAERRLFAHTRAAERALARADVAAAEGRWEDAVKGYRRALSRYEMAAPDRQRALDGAYGALLVGARAELAAGRFDRAEGLAREAAGMHRADPARAREAAVVENEVREARFGALLDAAVRSMDEGRYQEAYGLVQQAVDVYGEDAPLSRTARDLRERIVADGTLHVAVTPARSGAPAAERVPGSLLGDIDDLLAECLCAPPTFVAVVDPQAVRRELRRLGFDDGVPSDHRAATLGQEVGAQVMAVLYVEHCAYGGSAAPETRTAATRQGKTVPFELHRERTLDVRCAFRLVDTRDGRLLAGGHVDATALRRHTHAHADRRVADDLLLTREEHAWFDAERLRAVDREMEREAARDLADGLREAIFAEVVRRLP